MGDISDTATERPTVLVTGGAGYIGSHACKALGAAGFLPVAFDNLHRGHRELVRWGPLEVGDLNEPGRVAAVIEKHDPVAVMHFAALAYVGESVAEPERYYLNNVAGSAALLQAMRAMAQPLIVFSSTCAIYGEPEAVPIAEDHPQRPLSPYGHTKRMVEQMLADMESAHGFRFVALRYFNAAGADPDGETGELHDPETHLVPLALQTAAGRLEKLKVFGDDYPTPDGTCIRDYIHVSDLADAHVAALRHLLGGGGSLGLNLANGNGFSVREVVECVERVTGRAVPVEVAGRRAGDPPSLVGDASRARRMLGWKPRLTSLDDIVRSAWEFGQNRDWRAGY